MGAILPAISIDSAAADARFLPYIQTWIMDDSRMRLAEKSVRIGWTYGDAFKNVRKRLHHAKRDYLFATKDQASAAEYCKTCLNFAEIYKLTRSIITQGEDYMKAPRLDKEGRDTGFTDEVKFAYIKFDNGSRIIAFSSNPNAMLVYGGDVGLDEFAAHQNDEMLWETAQGRITMGYDIGVWSAHKGTDTLFNSFVREAQAGQGGWSYYRVTMADAIDMGYLDLIYKLTGKRYTKEEFLEDCRRRARLEEIFQQAYMCNPRGGTAAIVPWSSIQLCEQQGHWRERAHLEDSQIKEMFGEFAPGFEPSREARIQGWLAATFPRLVTDLSHHSLGYDVAASGQGDLACIYVDAKAEAGRLKQRGMLTYRTDDWHFHKVATAWFMRRVPAVKACGDETGLGRQICWELAKAFPGRFEGVNFASLKHDMGFGIMNQLAGAEKQWSAEDKDISSDYFALRKTFTSKRWTFGESANPLNERSHCDIAWAGALSSRAAASSAASFGWSKVHSDAAGDSPSGIRRLMRRAGAIMGL
jgi:phage FluMu gp28-like protein